MLKDIDKEIFDAIESEKKRQFEGIELIASENYVSSAVMEAVGSVFTNKYAEGYPSHRYYGGCENMDTVETLAIERLKKLFGAEHANVQPHCGTSANLAVYLAVLKPGDKILGMKLSDGGHLTHGAKVNVSGKIFESSSYGVNESGYINYDEVEKMAIEIKPKMIVAGASAYSREIDFKRFSQIAKKVGAYLLVDMAHIAGLVASGLHNSPVPYADFVTSTTHKTLRGPRGGIILCKEEYKTIIDKTVFPGLQGGPLMHVIAGKAVCFKEALEPSFKEYQKQILKNAKAMEEVFKENDIKMVSNGTDNHLILLDLTNQNITGAELEDRLHDVNITVNKNSIPNDPQKPSVTSGIRIGTPAITSRGMKESEAKKIAEFIVKVIKSDDYIDIKQQVIDLCKKFEIRKES